MKNNRINKALSVFALLGIVLLLSGCPYSGSVPIDNGTVMIPDNLSGLWIKPSDRNEDKPTTYLIKKTDKFHATASKIEYLDDEAEYDTTMYNLTLSDVSGDIFLNLREFGTTTYYYYKFLYDDKSKEVSLSGVSDYIKETFDSSSALKDFIARNKSLSFFYTNSTEKYVLK